MATSLLILLFNQPMNPRVGRVVPALSSGAHRLFVNWWSAMDSVLEANLVSGPGVCRLYQLLAQFLFMAPWFSFLGEDSPLLTLFLSRPHAGQALCYQEADRLSKYSQL